MKRSKRICLLLGVLCIVCIAALIALHVEEEKERISNSNEVILEIPSDTVQSLSWEYEDTSLSFHKEGEWFYDSDTTFPVDETKIYEMLEQFRSFEASFIIEGVEDYSQYGLSSPVCTINLSTEETSYEILLGDFSNMDSERYVSIGDGNVYLVPEDPINYFDAVLSDMIDHDETPAFNKVKQISFSGAETYTVSYEEDSTAAYQAEDVYFAEIDGEQKPLDTGRVETYLSEISMLELSDYVTYNATDEELKSYGLDSPELTVTVDYIVENEDGEETNETFVLNISRDPSGKSTEEDGGDEEAVTAYVRVGESQIVYQISESKYNSLMAASYNSLRHLEVMSADFADIYQIDITLENGEYTITSEQGEDTRSYYYGEEEIDISSLQNAIEELSADSFTEEEPTQKMEIGVIVYLENDYFPEVEMEFYRYDGNYCLAVVDGEPVSLVERSDVVDLVEAVNTIILN